MTTSDISRDLVSPLGMPVWSRIQRSAWVREFTLDLPVVAERPTTIDVAEIAPSTPALRLVETLTSAPHGPTVAGATLAA